MPPAIHPDHAVGWLCVLAEMDGRGAQAALLQTSIRGVPTRFHFARASFTDHAPDDVVLAMLCASLLRAGPDRPAFVVLRLDHALPPEAHAVGLEPLFRRAERPLVHPSVRRTDQFWTTHAETGSGAVGDFLDLAARDNGIWQCFKRAANASREAFADRRVTGAAGLGNPTTVFALTRPARRPASAHKGDERSLAERLWALLEPAAEPLSTTALEWYGPLMPFQTDGVQTLLRMNQLLLADDMGLGKTIQAIAAARILIARGRVRSCLVVAPSGLLDQWRREFTRWAPELSAIIVRGAANERSWQWTADKDVTLASFGVLRADRARAAVPAGGRRWDVVVVDEAQRIKNRNDTSDAVKAIRRVRSWALTGTPVENDEDELASIMEFVDYDDDSTRRRYRPGVELLERHRELQLRRRKQDVLPDLPEKVEAKCIVDLPPAQRGSYDRAEREGVTYLRSLGAEVQIRHVLELITRLKQICNADPRTGESCKVTDIHERLTELTGRGHKALVFSQYVNDVSGVAMLATRLQAFKPLTLTGETPLRERAGVVDRFKADPKHGLMVVSLRAGGVGLNLQEASYVFHLDRWWNPAVEKQAEDRSHRLGQTVKVHVFKYTCRDTIEERIERILERKQALFDALVDDVSIDLSTALTRDELLGLFGIQH